MEKTVTITQSRVIGTGIQSRGLWGGRSHLQLEVVLMILVLLIIFIVINIIIMQSK